MSLLSQVVSLTANSIQRFAVAGSRAADLPPTSASGLRRAEPGRERRIDEAMALTRWLLCNRGDDPTLAHLTAAVDEYVDVWTPVLHTTSRFELVSALTRLDDAIADVDVRFLDALEHDSTVVLIWQATGRFVRPVILDDDHLLEPTGDLVRVAGATKVTLTTGLRAGRVECYYDRLCVIEQMLRGSSGDDP